MRRAHGVRGAWAIEPMTDAPDVIFASGAVIFAGDRNGALSMSAGEKPKPVALRIEDGRKMNKEWLVRVREVADRDQADLWRGRYLLVDTARIPEPDEDEVYVFSLIGMTVEVDGQGPVGEVRDVYEAPQGLLLEVETATGRPLVPWHPGIVERVDEAARVIVLKPLEGLLG
ncbi:MAG: 16S rRNA processing protein RimM [Gemmatimonadaceae bacterium]|nr:16S rRNA processing protein RimM [Gemmatimonadaceae bacterium]MCC6430021.1 16S rRNA processing protein RimM [Gemmatimonadaceae bacterium]